MEIGLPEKVIKKTNLELIDLHKRVIKTYFVQEGVKFSTRQKFFQLYDYLISVKNIRLYFHKPVKAFIIALVEDRLDEICDLTK